MYSTGRSLCRERLFHGSLKVRSLAFCHFGSPSNSSLAGDGVFSVSQDGKINLVDLKTNKTTNLLATADVKDVCPSLLLNASLFLTY